MATDVADRASVLELPRGRHRRRALVLLVLAVFQLWLWGTRIVNLLTEAGSFSAAFVAVHLLLYAGAIAAALVLAGIGTGMWREARTGTDA